MTATDGDTDTETGDESATGTRGARPPEAAPDAGTTAAGPNSPPSAVRGLQVHVGELISASSALGLLVAMFATTWYGVAGVVDPSYARPAVSTAENGWDGLSIVRWVLAATIVVALGSVFLHASQREHGVKTDTSRAVAALGLLSSALLVYRVLIALPSGAEVIDQKLGAIIGLFGAIGIAIGGLESIGERRRQDHQARHRARRRAHHASGQGNR
jgi:hypothetical protein